MKQASNAALVTKVFGLLQGFDAEVRKGTFGQVGGRSLRSHLQVTARGLTNCDPAEDVDACRAAIRASLISMPAELCKVLPEDIVRAHEELLAEELSASGAVDAMALPTVEGKYPIAVWQGDMSKLVCDAVVNPANDALLGCFLPHHKCLDNILHAQAGPRLRAACMDQKATEGIHSTPNGQCMVTDSYALPSRFVYHTVGPCLLDFSQRHQRNPEARAPTKVDMTELESCYITCLDRLKNDGLSSIAFCCISTGIFAYPSDQACLLACGTVKKWMDRELANGATSLPLVIFNVFKDEDLQLYQQVAPRVFNDKE